VNLLVGERDWHIRKSENIFAIRLQNRGSSTIVTLKYYRQLVYF
jgi:hypothetical protein